jgi:hypothetical protein
MRSWTRKLRSGAVALAAVSITVFATIVGSGAHAQAQTDPTLTAQPPSFRQLFAGTLNAVLMSAGGALMAGLTQTVTGGINAWFARKQAKLMGSSTFSRSDPNAGPEPFDPSDSDTSASSDSGDTRFFNPTTGETLQETPQQFLQSAEQVSGTGPDLFAGVAFEVHAIGAGGASAPVDPATHEFRTGDRFVVFFRPSMPGRMTVFNINPNGIETQIDSTTMAAGQLSTLGPYQFANTPGDEQLRLVLQPCSTPELLTRSRDIINVSGTTGDGGPEPSASDDTATSSGAESSFQSAPADSAPAVTLSQCDGIGTRSLSRKATNRVRTRDIVKVAAEGSTNFALDPVSQQEIQSGSLDPREVTIRFIHR